jgi:hypothetical protein
MHIEIYVATIDPAKPSKSFFKCRPKLPHLTIILVVEGQQHTDVSCPRGLLRPRRKRQHDHCRTGQCDEYAPSHDLAHRLVGHRNESDQPVGSARSRISNVRFGSKADMPLRDRDFRFTPKSGHRTTLY